MNYIFGGLWNLEALRGRTGCTPPRTALVAGHESNVVAQDSASDASLIAIQIEPALGCQVNPEKT